MIVQGNFAVFHDLLTLAIWAMHRLKSNHCSNSSNHPLEDQCRQSVAARTTGPILWYGNLVDFGSFSEVLNNKSPTKEISFFYKFKIPRSSNEDSRPYWYRLYQALLIIEDLDTSLELKMTTEEERQGITICKEISLFLLDHQIVIEISPSGEVTKFRVNGSDFLIQGLQLRTDQSGSFIPQVFKVKDERNDVEIPYYSYTKTKTSLFLETLLRKTKGNCST